MSFSLLYMRLSSLVTASRFVSPAAWSAGKKLWFLWLRLRAFSIAPRSSVPFVSGGSDMAKWFDTSAWLKDGLITKPTGIVGVFLPCVKVWRGWVFAATTRTQ
jgi:hypothetical protein